MKKMYLKAAFAAVVILGSMMILGCTKERQLTIYGTVFHGADPLQGATVTVYASDVDGDLSAIGQTVSGSDGMYEFVFTAANRLTSTKGKVNAEYKYNSYYYWRSTCDFTFDNTSSVRVDINLQ